MIVAGKEQVQGWKEIAAYLGRDERTVKRWEKQRGLPVRRIPGAGRANVYILVSDLELWLAQDSSKPPSDPESSLDAVSSDQPAHRDLDPDLPGDPPPASALPEPPTPALDQPDTSPHPPLHPAILDPVSKPRRPRLHFSYILSFGSLALILAAFSVRTFFLVQQTQQRRAANLHPAHLVSITPRPRTDELYVQGLYLYEQRTPASLEQARRSFESAIAADPSDARAYAGLANAYLLLREYSTMPHNEAYAKAQAAAEHAIALDPDLPEAHASLGFIDFFSLWDTPAATREFNEALRLDPGCALAHHWYGSMLTHQGRYPEALEQLNLAQRLQPSSPAILASKAFALGLGGHRAEAVDMLEALGKNDLDTAAPHHIIANLSLVEPRNIPLFLDQTRRFAQIRNDRDTLSFVDLAASAYGRAGERGMWSEILSSERQRHPSTAHPTYLEAQAEAALGLNNDALRDFNTLAHQRNSLMVGIALDPVLLHLRQDPRFNLLLAEVGLPHPLASPPQPEDSVPNPPRESSPHPPASEQASAPGSAKAIPVSAAAPAH